MQVHTLAASVAQLDDDWNEVLLHVAGELLAHAEVDVGSIQRHGCQHRRAQLRVK